MNIKEKLFLLASSDVAQRKLAFESVKKRIPRELFEAGMTTTVYGSEAKLKSLQEDVLTFSLAGQKVVIFKNIEDLSEDIRDFLADNIEKICQEAYLIFEAQEDLAAIAAQAKRDKFLAALATNATLFKLAAAPAAISMEDFMLALRRNDLNQSLFILEKLFEYEREEKLGPVLLGIFTGRAAYERDSARKAKSLQYIWEADRGIKERGHEPRVVLEALLVKLLTL